MPYTKLQEGARAKYISPAEFIKQYSLSKSRGYQILALPEMQEAILMVGEKGKRVNVDKAYEIMIKLFN